MSESRKIEDILREVAKRADDSKVQLLLDAIDYEDVVNSIRSYLSAKDGGDERAWMSEIPAAQSRVYYLNFENAFEMPATAIARHAQSGKEGEPEKFDPYTYVRFLHELGFTISSNSEIGQTTQAESKDHVRTREYYQRLLRPQQAKFRKDLIAAYGCCLITATEHIEVLEAAHILPVSRNGKDERGNGLLLRCDIHSLFDKGLLKIDPETSRVLVDHGLTNYMEFNGKVLNLTDDQRANLKMKWN